MRPERVQRSCTRTPTPGRTTAGASGSQTTFNNGRAVIAAANEIREQLLDLAADFLEANRADLELVDGMVRVKGSRTSSRHHRRARVRGGAAPACCSAGARVSRRRRRPSTRPAASAVSVASRSRRRRSSPTPRGSRSIATPASSGCWRSRRRTNRARSSTRSAPPARSTAASRWASARRSREGVLLTDDGRQRNPYLLDYKLQTAADVPPIDRRLRRRARRRTAAPRALKGVAEPPCVPTPGAIANAIARGHRRAGPQLPMTPERVCDAIAATSARPDVDAAVHLVRRRSRALAPRPPGAGRWPAARTSSSATRQGKGAAAREPRRDRPDRRAARASPRTAAAACGIGALDEPRRRWPRTRTSARRWTAIADASAIVGSPATRHVGTIGGNIANASPAAETSGPLLCFGRRGRGPVGDAATAGSPSPTCSPGRAGRRVRPDELIVAVELPGARRRRQLLRPARVPPADGDRGRRRDGRRDARRTASSRDARIAITALAPTVRRVARGRGGAHRHATAVPTAAAAGAAAAAADAARRSPTSARRSSTAGRWPRSSSAGPSTRRDRPRPRRDGPDPRQRQPVRSALTMRYPVDAPGERHRATRSRSRPDRTLLSRPARRARPDRQQGGLRRLRVRRLHGPDRRPAGELLLVPRAAGGRARQVTTVEGLAEGGDAPSAPAGLPRAGRGPVRVLHAGDADQRDGAAGREPGSRREDEIRAGLSGNLCRCTGYVGIVAAVRAAAGEMAKTD